jgi:hypothetical protein
MESLQFVYMQYLVVGSLCVRAQCPVEHSLSMHNIWWYIICVHVCAHAQCLVVQGMCVCVCVCVRAKCMVVHHLCV